MSERHYSTSANGIGGKLKRRIEDFIVSEITIEGKKCNVILPMERKNTVVPEKPAGKEQLVCLMQKYNTETNMALKRISRFAGLSGKRFGYAGIKDKRAVTCQRISIWNPVPERLANFSSKIMQLRECEWGNGRVEIGALKGNDFEITVRDIALPESEARKRTEECLRELDEKGALNYFGEQRFGGIRNVSHLVGEAFVKESVEAGVMVYLTHDSELEESEVREARKNLAETRDFPRALKEFPVKYSFERAILNRLVKNPDDFADAFAALPKNLRYLFTHAYQSHLFNECIGLRIEAGLPFTPIEGDVTEEGVVTLPLFGFMSVLAEGEQGKIERKILRKEKISLDSFRIEGMPELSSKGARRKAIVFPENARLISISRDEFFEGKTSVKLGFYLPKGNYATTVMQEIMK